MKTAIVNSKEVFNKTKNPTLCLSALRVTGECHKCDQITKEIIHTPLNELLKELKCKPNISDEGMILLSKYDTLLQQREELQGEIDFLRKRIGLKPE